MLCLCHMVHNSIKPCLMRDGLVSKMYRTALVMKHKLYATAMWERAERFIRNELIITHHSTQKPEDRDLAASVLLRTLCCGLPDDLLQPRIKALRDEVLQRFVGCWKDPVLLFLCDGSCKEDIKKCRTAAVNTAIRLVSRMLFSSVMAVPVASRWWKAAPVARKILLGTAFHGIYGNAPRDYKAEKIPNDIDNLLEMQDEQNVDAAPANAAALEGKLQGYRVRHTFAFFSAPSTPCCLAILLQTMVPAEMIMAWLMRNDARLCYKEEEGAAPEKVGNFYGQQADIRTPKEQRGAFARRKPLLDRVPVVLQFFRLSESPVVKALARGAEMLDPSHWQTHWAWVAAYHPSTDSSSLFWDIWLALLPCLASLHWNVFVSVVLAPDLKLVFLASSDPVENAAAGERLHKLPLCCCPRGIRHLRAKATSIQKATSLEFREVGRQLANNIDFSIFDMECLHAAVRKVVTKRTGGLNHDNASMHEMASEISSFHKSIVSSAFPEPKPKLGRPSEGQKRKRYDRWNAFVAAHPPGRLEELSLQDPQISVASGQHLEILSKMWAKMSEREKEKYGSIATCAKAEMEGDGTMGKDEQQASRERKDKAFHSHWGLGDQKGPLTPELMASPGVQNRAVANEMLQWHSDVTTAIEHATILPKRVQYDDCCLPGACKNEAMWGRACAIFAQIRKAGRPALLDCWAFVGKGGKSCLCHVVLVCWCQVKPWSLVVLPLDSVDTPKKCIFEERNLPWAFKFSIANGMLEFAHHGKFFLSIAQEMEKQHCDTLTWLRLKVKPTAIHMAKVYSVERSTKIWMRLDDLDNVEADSGPFSGLESMGGVERQTRNVSAEASSSKESDSSESDSDFVYGDSANALGDAKEVLRLIKTWEAKAEEEHEEEEGEQGEDVAAPQDYYVDWPSYDKYICIAPSGKTYDVMDDCGRKIGELHPGLSRYGTYTAFALCTHKQHKDERCSRGRCWKGLKNGEPVDHVNRVLVKWLLEGQNLRNAKTHKLRPRR